MFLFLFKLLPLFIYPLGLACLFLALGLLLHRRPGWQSAGVSLALLTLLVFGNRWVAKGLASSLEWQYLPEGEIPEAEVIVILGGATRPHEDPRPLTEVNEGGDRLLYGAWLYHQGKAPAVLVSGGYIEWLGSTTPEAQSMRESLLLLGVPDEAIWLEAESRNTYENGLRVQAMLEPMGIRRIILVTSAMHMPRSVLIFRKLGFEVIPAPTDFMVTQAEMAYLRRGDWQVQLLNLVPAADNLELSTRVLKEYIGILVYRLRGWL
ncbi:YdcF family protein [Litorilinea aerophila]|uniref:YdcF family protein n=1 Tax=Litorilinea aerophila TaxID=1204385 RepID=A0A540VBE1_9CHLR|nr:YdcF family protein [Litorilinea aerophila]MCC9078716.1 YdcF family protein [Litorilinea aerophila]OUC05921.1 hypothetical protein RY27_24290 [Litorilinea aerophila]